MSDERAVVTPFQCGRTFQKCFIWTEHEEDLSQFGRYYFILKKRASDQSSGVMIDAVRRQASALYTACKYPILWRCHAKCLPCRWHCYVAFRHGQGDDVRYELSPAYYNEPVYIESSLEVHISLYSGLLKWTTLIQLPFYYNRPSTFITLLTLYQWMWTLRSIINCLNTFKYDHGGIRLIKNNTCYHIIISTVDLMELLFIDYSCILDRQNFIVKIKNCYSVIYLIH